MTGVKLGDRLLNIGCTDPSLLGAHRAKVGLSGRACAIVPDAKRGRARAARRGRRRACCSKSKQGCSTSFPFEDGAFNLIVRGQSGRPAVEHARPSSAWRCCGSRSGRSRRADVSSSSSEPRAAAWARSSSRRAPQPADPHYAGSGGAVAALEAEGFRAAPAARRAGWAVLLRRRTLAGTLPAITLIFPNNSLQTVRQGFCLK